MIKNSILFDIGGTKMRVAFSADGESFEAPQNVSTPKLYQEGYALFLDLIRRCAGDRKIEAVCGGIAGPFVERKRSLVASPNLGDWVGKPLKNSLEQALQAPIYIENDAAMVGLGEAVAGAGKGSDVVVYITVSTGVGGARIVGGKIDNHTIGFEPGHQILDHHTGETLESLISGKALEARTGMHPRDITDPNVWGEHARLLAVGLHNSIVHWSPSVVVLGGSMIIGNPAIPLDSVERHLHQTLTIFPELPLIKKAELGDFGGLYGALAYLKNI